MSPRNLWLLTLAAAALASLVIYLTAPVAVAQASPGSTKAKPVACRHAPVATVFAWTHGGHLICMTEHAATQKVSP
jgi:hypothetical protein